MTMHSLFLKFAVVASQIKVSLVNRVEVVRAADLITHSMTHSLTQSDMRLSKEYGILLRIVYTGIFGGWLAAHCNQ